MTPLSCDMEDLVETHLRKLRVTFRSRMHAIWGVRFYSFGSG